MKNKNSKTSISFCYEYYIRNKMYITKETMEHDTRHAMSLIKHLKEMRISYVEDITDESIANFIRAGMSKGNKNITINKAVGCLKTIFNFCISMEAISTENTLNKFKKLHEQVPDIEIIPEYLIGKVYSYIDYRKTNTLSNHIDRVIIRLLNETGMRRSELARLKIKNININSNEIRLTETKNKKSRTVFISDETATIISMLIIRANLKSKDNLIINSKTLKPIEPNGISKKITRISKAIGLTNSSQIQCHQWRHTCGTRMLENGFNIREVQEYLGHSDIKMTERYTHINNDKLKEKFKVKMFKKT